MFGECERQRSIVDDRRVAVHEIEFGRTAVSARDTVDDPSDARSHSIAHSRVGGAHRAAELYGIGDDVVAVAAGDRPDRYDDAGQRIGLPRRNVLQREDDRGGTRDRIRRFVRRGTVAADAADDNVKLVGGSIDRSRCNRDAARFEPNVDVEHRNCLDLRLGIHHAGFDHGQGAARPFFRGLEEQHDIAGQRRARGVERARSTDEHGCMRIVPAGVHPAGNLGGENFAGFLANSFSMN